VLAESCADRRPVDAPPDGQALKPRQEREETMPETRLSLTPAKRSAYSSSSDTGF